MAKPTDEHAAHERGALALLTLVPLLIGAATFGTAVALGVATAFVAAATATAVALLASPRSALQRVTLAALVAAALVTCLDFACHALLPALHARLGSFLLPIAPTALLFALVDEAPRRAVTALIRAPVVVLVFVIVGLAREIVGQGSLLADAGLLVGASGDVWRISLPWSGMLGAALAPGALFAAAGLLALRLRSRGALSQ